mgnify:CR=1 FL=1
MLSETEKQAIFDQAHYFEGHWGNPKYGYSPHGVVAVMRGAKFEVNDDEEWGIAHDELGCVDEESLDIGYQATLDVAQWLGFGNHFFTYTSTFLKEGRDILKRANVNDRANRTI